MRNFHLYAMLAVACVMSLLIAAPACVKLKGADQKNPSSIVSDATLANAVDYEGKPVNASTAFLVNAEVIYLSARLNNAPANTQVLVKLTYVDGEASGLANTTMYNNTKSGGGTGYIAFAMKPPPGGFPQGNYTVSVSANGVEVTNTPFKVENLSANKGWPRINKFTVSANTVPLGQPVTLSWDVSDATRITLQPEVGAIPAVGTRSLSPNVTTTYEIVASNDAGATKSQATVNVSAALAGAPDLTVTDIWMEGTMIYYKVKNTGKIDSPPTYTHLWVQNLFPAMGGSSFVDVLKPGQEKTLTFSSYDWPYRETDKDWLGCIFGADLGRYIDATCLNYTVKVCADARDESKEASETNNCMTKIWGLLFDYNMVPSAHLASWRNSSGEAPAQGAESSRSGAYIKMSDGGLEMVPDQVPQGWIQGYWGYFYTDRQSGRTLNAAIKVPASLHFVSRVGLAPNATGSDGVTFKLGIRDMSDQTNFLPGKTMKTPGVYENWDIDLKDYVDQKVFFILRVEAIGSPTFDYAIWKEARLVQVNN